MRACPDAWWDDGLFDMEWISEKRRGAKTDSVCGVFSLNPPIICQDRLGTDIANANHNK